MQNGLAGVRPHGPANDLQNGAVLRFVPDLPNGAGRRAGLRAGLPGAAGGVQFPAFVLRAVQPIVLPLKLDREYRVN